MVMRCLIVDDSTVFLRAARALLQMQGIVVITASTGEDARRMLEDASPDVVLIDIDLGEESGFELAAELSARTGGENGGPQILLISSHGLEDFEELVRDSPARGFISKSALSATAIRSLINQA
jgi:DNA-binding response OmpR family regulator